MRTLRVRSIGKSGFRFSKSKSGFPNRTHPKIQISTFFSTVNQMFGVSSHFPTTAEHTESKSNRRVQFRQYSRKLGGAAEHLIDGSEKRIYRLRLIFEF